MGPVYVQGVKDCNGVEGFDFFRQISIAAFVLSPLTSPDESSNGSVGTEDEVTLPLGTLCLL